MAAHRVPSCWGTHGESHRGPLHPDHNSLAGRAAAAIFTERVTLQWLEVAVGHDLISPVTGEVSSSKQKRLLAALTSLRSDGRRRRVVFEVLRHRWVWMASSSIEISNYSSMPGPLARLLTTEVEAVAAG